MENNSLDRIIERQKEFQRGLGWPIDSVSEIDRNELSEKYVFKAIEELVELRREFPSVMNPWSKHQKPADLNRVKEEFSDVLFFLINLAIVWRFSPEDMLDILDKVQTNNFKKIKERKMSILNTDILKIPNRVSGVGGGSLFPEYVFIGQNPGQGITQGYVFWSNPEDGSSKVLLPALNKLGITRDMCYFTNVVKCTTPNNVEPDPQLTEFYKEFLVKELDILRFGNPHMKIITMGNWATDACPFYDAQIKHPAYVLRGGMTHHEYDEHLDRIIKELK